MTPPSSRHLVAGRLGFAALAAVLMASSVPTAALAQDPAPDKVFYGGPILTMRPGALRAEAIALRGAEILAVGTEAEILALGGSETRYFDLEGATLMPGIVDAHTHLLNDAGRMGLTTDEAQQLAIENGITSLGNLFTNQDLLATLQNAQAAGQLRVRTSVYLIRTDNCGNDAGTWYQDHAPTRNRGEFLRIGGVKIFTDGGTCGRAALSVPRPDGDYGALFHEQDALNALVAEVNSAGYQAVLHAVGDRAVETAQNAIEHALDGGPNVLRHRIDHNTIVRPDLLARYGEIGIIPSLFGWIGTCREEAGTGWIRSVGAEQASWISPNRAILDANPGLPVAWHGDDPWVGPVNPILELQNLVSRIEMPESGGVCHPPEWLAATAIDVEEALAMMTTGAAYALDRDSEVGMLDAGMLADMVLLSANPLDTPAEQLHEIQVAMTMVGGVVEYGDLPTEVSNVSREPGTVPTRFGMPTVFPNPVEDRLTLAFDMEAPGPVTVEIRDMLGRIVVRLTERSLSAGPASLPIDLSITAPGVYVVTVAADADRRSVLVARTR